MDIRALLVQCNSVPVQMDIEGLSAPVFIRRMTLGEADSMNEPPPKNGAVHSTAVRLLAKFLGDEQGKAVFDLANPADVEALKGIPARIAAKLLEAGNTVNVPPKEDAEKKA